MPDRKPGSKDYSRIPDSEKVALERFFRSNIAELASAAEAWFNLPNIGAEIVEREGAEAVLEKIKKGETIGPDRTVSEEAAEFMHGLEADTNRMVREENAPMKAIDHLTSLLADVDQKFSGNDLMWSKHDIYRCRAFPPGYLIEYGAFKTLPHGNKLRSLCCLSIAMDMMKAETELGTIGNLATHIGECFGYAEMQVLQHRVVQKTFGSSANLVFGNTFRPVPRLSMPRDPEIAAIQRTLVSRLQGIM